MSRSDQSSFAAHGQIGLIKEISPADGMFDPDYPEAYFQIGESALRCIRLAMTAAGKDGLHNILDFPCGHGRVLRTLKQTFPDAALTASDIDRDGVDFCVRALGATGVYSDHVLGSVALAGGFDLIWVGSLFTLLPEARWGSFLKFLRDRLAPGGLLLFTTHGRWAAQLIREGQSPLGGSKEAHLQMLRDYEATGFGFIGTEGRQAYGTSLAKPAAVLRRLEAFEDLRLLSFFERGWGQHQDVVACQQGFTPAG